MAYRRGRSNHILMRKIFLIVTNTIAIPAKMNSE